MATVAIASDSSKKSSQSMPFERSATSREASFSSYLNGSEENFILQIAEESRRLKQKNKSEYEGEIDVFTADKYFNDSVGEMSPNIVSKDDQLDIASLKQKIRPRTPSVRSESSWNSRSSLIRKPKNEQREKKTNRAKSFLASIGCRCTCNDEDSVHVDNQNNEGKPREVTKKGSMDQFRRPDSKQLVADTHDQVPKTSLEVFGSPIQTKGDKSSMEKHVGKLAWEEAEREDNSVNSNGKYNDTDSDASSDLFEIESFSTNTNINPSLTRQASDVMSAGCVSPTSCYAPSEVSVQWSTVTASMVDFSVMSDSEELDIITSKQTINRRPGILSSCKSYKAVRVAGETHRATEKTFIPDFQKQQLRMEVLKPTTRFHTESKLDTSRKDVQHRFTTHSTTTGSQIKSVPHPMYIH